MILQVDFCFINHRINSSWEMRVKIGRVSYWKAACYQESTDIPPNRNTENVKRLKENSNPNFRRVKRFWTFKKISNMSAGELQETPKRQFWERDLPQKYKFNPGQNV
jgi:hypothetical protein